MKGNVRTSDGKRPLTSAGFDVFQETMDQDFIDPTRKLQNRRDASRRTGHVGDRRGAVRHAAML